MNRLKGAGNSEHQRPPLDSDQLSPPSTSDVLELQCTAGSPGGLFKQILGPMPSGSDAVVWVGGGDGPESLRVAAASPATHFENYCSTS